MTFKLIFSFKSESCIPAYNLVEGNLDFQQSGCIDPDQGH